VGVTVGLPAIADAATTLEGTAYDLADGTSVRDANPGQLGAGGTVGVSGLPLARVERPELEIANLRSVTVVANGLDVQAADVTIRDLAIVGFGSGVFNNNFTDIALRDAAANALIERDVIGAGAGAFTDPGAASRTDGAGVLVDGAPSGTIRDNLIGYASGPGIWFYRTTGGWTVSGNEVRGNAQGAAKFVAGIDLDAGSGHQVSGNLVVDNQSVGVQLNNAPGAHVVRENTITGNGVGDPPNQTAGVRVDNTTAGRVELNRIEANYGAGVLVTATGSGVAISRNAIVQNGTIANLASVGASGQIGIDLLSASDGQARGTAPYVTPNDAGDSDTGGNGLLNFPVITSAVAITGAAATTFELDVPAGWYRVEFYRNPSGVDASGYGEGETLAGATVVSHPGGGVRSYSTSFAAAPGDTVTATATACLDGAACASLGSTSEFGAAVGVGAPVIVKRAYRLDGTPIANGTTVAKGALFKFVLYINNRGGAATDVSLRDVLDPAFDYLPGTIRVSNAVGACASGTCSGAEEAAIVAATAGGTAVSDAPDGDPVSYTGAILEAGDRFAANARLDIAAASVYALSFIVRMR
jgi:hypothetical protein